jgi:hypothetical protein
VLAATGIALGALSFVMGLVSFGGRTLDRRLAVRRRLPVCPALVGSTPIAGKETIGSMNPGAGSGEARGSRVGYLVVLLGAALFVASCFVPYYGFEGPAQRAFSLYEQQTSGPFGGVSLGRLLYLFAGVAIATSIAVVGVARSKPQSRVPSMLIGAVAAWSLPWIGIMLSTAQTTLGFRLRSATGSKQ